MRTVDIYGVDNTKICVKGLGSTSYFDCSGLSEYAGSFLLESSVSSLRIHCIFDGTWSFAIGKSGLEDFAMPVSSEYWLPEQKQHPLSNVKSVATTSYLRLKVPDDTILTPEGEFAENSDDIETEERFHRGHHEEEDQ